MPPVDKDSTANADGLANVLIQNLIAGKEFTLPAIDLTAPEFNYTLDADGPLSAQITRLAEADLTERKIDGTGLFDGLMQALALHLNAEYKAGRITGAQYSEAYIQLTTTAMGQAVSFLLSKEQAYWQAQLAQKQALAADIAATNAMVALQITRAQLGVARMQLNQAEVEYAIGKMKLSNEDVQYAIGEAQLAAQQYQNQNTLPAQLAGILGQNEINDYNLTYLLPKELEKSTKAIEQSSAQISQIVAQKDQVLYQTANNLPAQDAGIRAETALKDYQLSSLLPAQFAGLTADNVAKDYTNQFILPANLATILENNEGNRAKTMNTRSDGVTPVAGVMGKQNELYDQQISSYKRSDEAKVAKMYLDTWITQKSMDEGLTPPSSLTDSNINAVLGKLRTSIGMV